MTGQKKIFNQPIVRAKINRLRFPNTCPVCGRPTTTTTWLTTTPHKKTWLRPHWDPGFYASSRKRLGLSTAPKKSFRVHVCEDHTIADDGNWRFRGISSFLLTIVASVSIFVVMFAGSDYWAGRGIQPWVQVYFLVLGASLAIGYVAFRPNPLESAVGIIGFDFDVQYVWLQLKKPEYRAEFMKENDVSAELVNWIVKV